VSDNGANTTTGPSQFEVILTKLTDLSEKIGQMLYMKDRVEEVSKSVNFLSSKFDDQNKDLKAIKTENKAMRDEISVLMNDVFDLKKQNEELRLRVDEMEQYSRNSNVEIVGIPETPQEDVFALVQTVGEKLGMTITADDVEAVHRVPTQSKKMPKPIVVKFQRRRRKEEMVAKGRKTRLQGTDLHDTFGDRYVFINEHLTQERKKLLAACREKKTELDVKYLWTKAGIIFMKKTEDSMPVKIQRLQDLHLLR
jgi:hypothetical protein